DQGGSGGYLVVRESKPGVRVLHIHIVEKTDVQWQNYIAFRDCLRKDKRVRNAYARLKKSLAHKFPEDRKSYTDGKDDFVKNVLLKISE
ncbi:MAG: GrpB family protein, partial [Candidatus Saganbacteria bacterium]|nr:GrpB family protein [Candidatus Saganbacteria bacterium]